MKEHHKVSVLLGVALFTQMLLFSVAYSGASWTNEETPMPDLFGPKQISVSFDRNLGIIADNLRWSVSTAVESAKPMAINYLGLGGWNSIRSAVNQVADGSLVPHVLGAYAAAPMPASQ